MSTANAKSVLRLTDTGNREANGLRILGLDLYDPSGKIVESWLVNSGQPDAQELLPYADPASRSRDMRPIPEETYNVGHLDFAGGKFDWLDSHGPGLGDFWADIKPSCGEYKRGAFGFHWDENRGASPGSAGCVVFPTKTAVEDFVRALRKYDPPQMVVDWGFGTVPAAPKNTFAGTAKPQKAVTAPTKVAEQATFVSPYINSNGFVIDLATDLKAGQYQVFSTAQKGGGVTFKLIKK